MKTRTFVEDVAIYFKGVKGDSFNRRSDYCVTWQQLRNAHVGKKWSSLAHCGRDMIEEDLTVIYKDNNGCAATLHTEISSDSPDPVHTKNVELIWFEFNNRR